MNSGVLLRQFDTLDDREKPWMPCPKKGYNNWCADFSDRWAASIVNHDARHLYLGKTGGLILAPSATLFCACPEDCNSQAKKCKNLQGVGDGSCIPGCFPKGKQCTDLHQTHECSFPPTRLRDALQAQLDRPSFLHRNNEVVIDLRSITSRLPNAIAGFFFPSTFADASPDASILPREVRSKFIDTYKLDPTTAPPLVIVEMSDSGEILGNSPFSLAVE